MSGIPGGTKVGAGGVPKMPAVAPAATGKLLSVSSLSPLETAWSDATATAVKINGTTYDLSAAKPDLGGAANPLGSVFLEELEVGSASTGANNTLRSPDLFSGFGILQFQPRSGNNASILEGLPSGTKTESRWQLFNASDRNNSGIWQLMLSGRNVSFNSLSAGTGLSPNSLVFGSIGSDFLISLQAGLGFEIDSDLTSKQSTTSQRREQFRFAPEWIDSTDATRKARVTLSVYDTAIRTVMIAEANGSAAKIGFFNATAVVQQSLTYSRTGETTPEAQLRAALANLGLVADNTTA